MPYRGAAPIMQDLLAGQIDLTCPEAGQTLALYRSGKIKAYAVMGSNALVRGARRADHRRGRARPGCT